jgi:sugar phosphate isomerase/epimerase
MQMDRRLFFGVAAAGAGAAWGQKIQLPKISSTFKGVVVGCNTYSLPQLPIEEAIPVIAKIGFGEAEIHPRHMEPFSPFGGRGVSARAGAKGPAKRAGMSPADRQTLREWRLTVPLSQFENVGRKFRDAGLYVYAYNFNYRDDMTDGELERSFEMTRALGAQVITAAGSEGRELATRLDVFAKKHKIRVGLHNHAGTIRSEADYDAALKGLSEYSAMTLDIGHYVAANADPVALLRKRHDDIVALHIKDRKRNDGPDMPFGEGDTPIKEVLTLVRESKWRIPCNIEWEIAGDDRVEAVRRSFEYCKQMLLS